MSRGMNDVLLPSYDHQIKSLSESYIAFLYERAKIEETYVDSLTRLHRNTRALDNLLDDKDPSTVRVAWRELRDNVEREAEARLAFVTTLKSQILPPLYALRETQERTRKRIKEDLRDSTQAHQEYAENVLPRLKRAYLKKCQETEEYRLADRVVPGNPAGAVGPGGSSSSSTKELVRRASFSDKTSTTVSFPLHSPTPSNPGLPQPTSRNRSPTGTAADGRGGLSDLAHQGKKGLNQLMGFLEERRERSGPGGSLKDNGERAQTGLRAVKAKREADEADKEYRKGVHWLETLRLRRSKTLRAGYNSLEAFVFEAGNVMTKALQTYADAILSTVGTCTSLATYGQNALERIDTVADLERVRNFIDYAFQRSEPTEVYYFNYHVGECKDLVFGVSLADYATARNRPNDPPSIILKCVKEIESRGMNSEGIYRISGRHSGLQDLTHRIEKNEEVFEFNPNTDDVFMVAGLLKLYLRELPEPLFRLPYTERIQHSEAREEHARNQFPILRSKIRRLPPVNQVTLKILLEHLARVAANSTINKMDARNLAIVWATVVFGEDTELKLTDIMPGMPKDTVMEDLITYSGLIFEDLHGKRPTVPLTVSTNPPSYNHTPQQVEAPLPVIPQEEQPSGVDYGSSFTKITTLPPRSSTSREQDFTPTLPSRPPQSIHPSRRTNTSSSDNGPESATSPISPIGTSFPDKSVSTPASPRKLSFNNHVEEMPESPPEPVIMSDDGSPLSDYVSYGGFRSAVGSPEVEHTEAELNGSAKVMARTASTGAVSQKSAKEIETPTPTQQPA